MADQEIFFQTASYTRTHYAHHFILTDLTGFFNRHQQFKRYQRKHGANEKKKIQFVQRYEGYRWLSRLARATV